MDTNFLISLNKTLPKEGLISKNLKDQGGFTGIYPDSIGKGISREKHPSWKGWNIIDNIYPRSTDYQSVPPLNNNKALQNAVEEFYRTEFWDKIQGDKLSSQLIADELFDTSVNLGVSAASEILQRTLYLLNKNGSLYPDIVIDGIIGSQTLETLNKCIAANGEKLIFNLLNFYQAKRYIEIMEHDHSQEIFIGWFTRIEITNRA